MPFIFPDLPDGPGSITVTPTGSLGVSFMADSVALPAAISVTATNSALVMTTFSDLALVTATEENWQYVELTDPLPSNETYTVRVYFDDVEVHSEVLEVPAPGKLRGRVLRQRVYEVLFTGYMNGNIESRPYGSPFIPKTVNQDFKSTSGTVVEVGAAELDEVHEVHIAVAASSADAATACRRIPR